MTTPSKHLCLFFGSLRLHSKRGYNHDRFGDGTQRYIRTLTIDGYDLYSLGAYPAICPGAGKVVCELHEVEGRAFRGIQAMERGAGYTEATIDLPEGAATIFTYDPNHLMGCPKVASGDWV